jgi:hypothetical protein
MLKPKAAAHARVNAAMRDVFVIMIVLLVT